CPSIFPFKPLSACSRACLTSLRDRNSRKSTAMIATISGPPANSAAANCQPSNTIIMIDNSATRLVDASSNAIAAVKSAPLRKTERASATAAYEQDDEAAPNPQATASVFGESLGSSFV